MMTLWTLLACVADGAIVAAFFGGLLAYWKNRRSIPYLTERERVPEREWVCQRYIALLDRGLSAPLSLPDQQEIRHLSQRWCELGLPQTPLGAPFPERQMTRAR
jgi:uncharacterized iron-regulated membrane protein